MPQQGNSLASASLLLAFSSLTWHPTPLIPYSLALIRQYSICKSIPELAFLRSLPISPYISGHLSPVISPPFSLPLSHLLHPSTALYAPLHVILLYKHLNIVQPWCSI